MIPIAHQSVSRVSAFILVWFGLAFCAQAQSATSLNTCGMMGLIDMPTAESLDDADLATTHSLTEEQSRVTLTLPILPGLTGAFRYRRIEDFGEGALFDRSSDLHYRLVDEGRIRPALAVGLRDFAGNGIFGSESVVASKTMTPDLEVA